MLKIAVAAYVTVISLMAAHAMGRATTTGDAAARWVALGACVFMVSDSLIAIDRFLAPGGVVVLVDFGDLLLCANVDPA